MLKLVVLAAVVVIAGVLIYAAMQPDTFRIERSAEIQAPPEKIYPLISDLKRWGAWSPWEKKDPQMTRRFGPVTEGKGASYAWAGNKNVGEGEMRIADAAPSSRVEVALHFIKPFEARNTAEFTLTPKDGGTVVTWAMHGPSPYLSKLICLVFSMDKMVGPDFEAGLAAMKATAEQR